MAEVNRGNVREMKKASVINFKGGVGKTTLSLHLACYLARHGRVLLIDVDHQSSLSLVVLQSDLWQSQIEKNATVNRVFDSFTNRKVALPKKEIILQNAFYVRDRRQNIYPSLDFVSAQFELDDSEIDLASTNFGNPTVSEWEKRTLLCNWLDAIDAGATYDYVVFDCPPATNIVSQNALACSNCYIIPVIPDELSSRGVTHFNRLVSDKIDDRLDYLRTTGRVTSTETPVNYVPRTKMAGIVPNMMKQAGRAESGYTNIHTEQLAALRKQWSGAILQSVGESYTGIAEAVNAGWPVWNYGGNNAKPQVVEMMERICTELKARIDAS